MVLVTAIEEVIRIIGDTSPTVPVFSRVPREKPPVFYVVDTGTPSNTATVLDSTPVFVKAYSTDLEETLSLVSTAREIMWNAHGNTILGWVEAWGPHETLDPDLPDWHVWQVGGTLYQRVL